MVSLVIFSATEFLPGDAASLLLGQQATPTSLENLRHKMGLDRHPVVRYTERISGAARGDLGVSPRSGVSITSMIKRSLPNSPTTPHRGSDSVRA